jgi:hypothetical protein
VSVVAREGVLEGRSVLSAAPPLEASSDGVAVLALFGVSEAPGGGSPTEVLGGFAQRLAELARHEVVTFPVMGLDETPGELSVAGVRTDTERVVDSLGSSVVVVAFDVLARPALEVARDPRVLGVALVDPRPVEDAVAWGARVRTGAQEALVWEGTVPRVLCVVAPPEAPLETLTEGAQVVEVHRLTAPSATLVLDARVLAIVAGWIERAPWAPAAR